MVRVMRALTIAPSMIMLTVLILSFQPYQLVHAQTAIPLESKALAYVENVLPFNMSYYTVTVGSTYSLPSAPNDPTITQAVDTDLKSNGSSIHVVCVYVNGALHQCGVSPTTGAPVIDRTYASVNDVAARVLRAHQEQTGLDSTSLLNMLSLVNDTETTNVRLGDVNLSVSHFPDIAGLRTVNGMPVPVLSNSSFSVTFHWMDTQNGITRSLIALSFDNGVFYNLQDERAINLPDNTTSKTSEQQAFTQQENSTLPNVTAQPTQGTSTQTNQLTSDSSQKNADQQNPMVIPFLIVAVIAFVAVLFVVLTYRSKMEAK